MAVKGEIKLLKYSLRNTVYNILYIELWKLNRPLRICAEAEKERFFTFVNDFFTILAKVLFVLHSWTAIRLETEKSRKWIQLFQLYLTGHFMHSG